MIFYVDNYTYNVYLTIMKMTQNKIANAVGCTQAQISRVLSRKVSPSVRLAKRIEKAAGIPWQSWFEDSPQIPEREPERTD